MGTKGERRLPPHKGVVDHYTITPDEIPTFLNADACHRAGITGEGIVVGIVDSGWYDHDYFALKRWEFRNTHRNAGWQGSGNGWNAPTLVYPGGIVSAGNLPNPGDDTSENSHGTGMVANLLSVAPGVRLRMYSRDKQSFLECLETAIAQCQIISLSKAHDPATWGNGDQARAMTARYRNAFATAKRNGKIVLHASGNDGSRPWPIENATADLIKVGGVHRRRNGVLEAADYAMAHGGRMLPDICGLCGMRPGGAYIWLPTDPDRDRRDRLAPGWALASGTSSATPQVAGVVALMAQARKARGLPPLGLERVRSILRSTATPVNLGVSADGIAANPRWTLLVDAARAVEMATAQ